MLVGCVRLAGQQDSCCSFNPGGKKEGYCRIYLDEKLRRTDSADAHYYGFEFYDDGEAPFPRFIDPNNKVIRITFTADSAEKGKPTALNGVLRWFRIADGEERIYLEEAFRNGYALTSKEFSADGRLAITWDFTRLYRNIPGTLLATYREDIRLLTLQKAGRRWLVKKGKRWRFIKAD